MESYKFPTRRTAMISERVSRALAFGLTVFLLTYLVSFPGFPRRFGMKNPLIWYPASSSRRLRNPCNCPGNGVKNGFADG